jgi:hypothetical protein
MIEFLLHLLVALLAARLDIGGHGGQRRVLGVR